MGICFGSVPFSTIFHVRDLPEFASIMSAVGPAVFNGMVGCLGSVFLVKGTPGLPPLLSWLVELWNAVSVLVLRIVLASGLRLISGMRMIWPWK